MFRLLLETVCGESSSALSTELSNVSVDADLRGVLLVLDLSRNIESHDEKGCAGGFILRSHSLFSCLRQVLVPAWAGSEIRTYQSKKVVPQVETYRTACW